MILVNNIYLYELVYNFYMNTWLVIFTLYERRGSVCIGIGCLHSDWHMSMRKKTSPTAAAFH